MSTPVIDRYEIRQGLGRGAMGSVYLAFDPKMGREVALKVLDAEWARNAKARQRFEREARTIAALRHPNIVDIFDYSGSDSAHLFLVMELIRGPHIGSLCRTYGPLPESVVAAIGVELASGLAHAHGHGIVHRDLKPENVFVDKGRVVLADFGIAKATQPDGPLGREAASPHTDVVGTPGFMAPEQVEQKPVDGRTDVFSLGALLYYLATGKLPFEASSIYMLAKEFRESRPVPIDDVAAHYGTRLAQLVQRCLEIDPDLRPASADEVRTELRAILDELGVGDARDLLASFQDDPEGFPTRDHERQAAHLMRLLKVAVRDGDADAATPLRDRLHRLDPKKPKYRKVTGVRDLLGKDMPDVADALGLDEGKRWRRIAVAAAAVVVVAAAGAGLTWGKRRVEETVEQVRAPAKTVAVIDVEANEPTAVFLNGHALGNTPGFAPAIVETGSQRLELVHARRGRLTQSLELKADGKVRVVVDWKKKKVRVSEEP